MASAEQTYVDPSALRSVYVHDDRSRRFCGWLARLRGALPITRYARAELTNAVALGVFRGEISPGDAEDAITDFSGDLRSGRLVLVDIPWRRTLDHAAELASRHTPRLGTRALDVLHVASAVTLGSTRFVTYDERQAKLARAIRMNVLSP